MSNIIKFVVVGAIAIGGATLFFPKFQKDNIAEISPAAGNYQEEELKEILAQSLKEANAALEEANKKLEEQNTFHVAPVSATAPVTSSISE